MFSGAEAHILYATVKFDEVPVKAEIDPMNGLESPK
jgi:hypothetical protein